MDILSVLAEELNIKRGQVEVTVKLIDEGNTIPFIARYRKEMTGSLSDEILRALYERLSYLRNVVERQETVIKAVKEQDKLTEELEKDILAAMTLVELEDLYRPFKPKRRTRAMIAKEKGLEPLAQIILEQNTDKDIYEIALSYVCTEEGKEVKDAQEAVDGAKDIIAEQISDEAKFRTKIKSIINESGLIKSSAKDKDESTVYDNYYEYSEKIKTVLNHRILAINRGESQKVLTVGIECDEDKIFDYLRSCLIKKDNRYTTPILEDVIKDAYKRLIFPSVEREIRNDLTQRAEDEAIKVFSKNLVQLLMQPPIKNKTVLGWDPAFRTGCKLAIVDDTGKVLDTKVIYPTAPQNKVEESKLVLSGLVDKYKVDLIALGNGTASRESEKIIADFISEKNKRLSYAIVSEAGASVYSASKLGTEEFPNFDVGQRSAASIARRLQDPLSELVKIDPKSIGVGQYQHDMNQKRLGDSLGAVVQDCVNRVGVDLNTASYSLLEYVSGINKTIAKNIIEYRSTNGAFKNRKELLKVSKLGPKAYEQCAGFLRIKDGDEPLDYTGVHPESYEATKKILKSLNLSLDELDNGGIKDISRYRDKAYEYAKELGIGEITIDDILNELQKPGRDIRDELPGPVLRSDVMDFEDLKVGMTLKGVVRNVIDFGVFVDIGVHYDGLIHISKLSKKYIKHPLDVVSIGDILDVEVIDIDDKKHRIGLKRAGI